MAADRLQSLAIRKRLLKQRQPDNYIARFKSIAGVLTSAELRHIADIADEFGRGFVNITTRQSLEVPWIDGREAESLKLLAQAIERRELNTGSAGSRVRAIAACPGTELCRLGVVNSQDVARKLDERFFAMEMPTRTKISVAGCPNACSKPQENDIGLLGVVLPVLEPEKCNGCGECLELCPRQALTLVGQKAVLDTSACLFEGDCIRGCPRGAFREGKTGYMLYVGGRVGRSPELGQLLWEFVPEERAVEAVESVLTAFRKSCQAGERVGDTVKRVGLAGFGSSQNLVKKSPVS